MFIGHFGVALAAKRIAPKSSLGTLFAAAQLVDLLWPIFLLLGVEHVKIEQGNTVVTPLNFYDYPFTHSLFGGIVWAVILSGLVFLFRRNIRSSSVIFVVVLSHWFLDLLVHRPDLPILPGSTEYYGFGLWNSLWSTIALELLIFGIGIWIYIRNFHSFNRARFVGFIGLIVFLVVMWLGNIFGPPPPSEFAIAVVGNSMWLLVLWAFWADKASTDRLLN